MQKAKFRSMLAPVVNWFEKRLMCKRLEIFLLHDKSVDYKPTNTNMMRRERKKAHLTSAPHRFSWRRRQIKLALDTVRTELANLLASIVKLRKSRRRCFLLPCRQSVATPCRRSWLRASASSSTSSFYAHFDIHTNHRDSPLYEGHEWRAHELRTFSKCMITKLD
jgi:hypothetical protein